jgi:antitoxin component YwqK of YwqJK toxin-antitoxin module
MAGILLLFWLPMKKLISIAFVFVCGLSFSQGKDTLNRMDSNGKKYGWWRVYTTNEKNQATKILTEEGKYQKGKKTGNWISYYENGAKKSEMGYSDGKANGKFTEYYESGCMRETGTFKGMHYAGNYKMYWENGLVRQEKNFNDKGELDGKLVYRYINGNPEMEASYIAGKTVEIKRYFTNGDLKEKTVYNEKGPETTTYTERTGPDLNLKDFEMDCSANKLVSKTIVDTLKFDDEPDQPDVLILDKGKEIKNNQKNKDEAVDGNYFGPVYKEDNKTNKNITEDGEFRNGKLWNGKKYIYDKNGLIRKVEIWKEGKYFADGQLE